MYLDYKQQILLHYQEKAAAGALSTRLTQPSPAQLREECLTVCGERYDRKDHQILRTFFGPGSDRAAYLEAIQQFDTNKFKPLVNFLRKPSIETDVKNVELLAWLIDFQPRPFELGKKYGSTTPERPGDKPEEIENIPTTSPAISGKPEPNSRRKIIILMVLMAITIGTVIYWASAHRHPVTAMALTGNEKCMYWTGDHYQPITCSQKHGDTVVVALDSEKIIRFMKITQPDTITHKSKGAVWYVKINGNIEFYTSDGYHPTDTQRRLRPITDYIINKYIPVKN